MIALDCQPLSIVEDLGFVRLMRKLKPNYKMPSRKYFTTNVINSMHSSVLNDVKNLVKESQHISLTTDIWTSNSNDSFISFTGHCIDSNFYRKTAVLRVKPFPDKHSADNIREMIQTTILDYNISFNKIHLIVSDNAPNMIKGIRETGISHLPCFLHTLQLVIHDCIFKQEILKEIISKAKKIVGHFRHSNLAYSKLYDLQLKHDVPQHKLIQDISTRWNSTFFMLERLFEQKTAIVMYCLEMPNLPILSANEWFVMEKVTKLLKIFHSSTLMLSKREALVSDIWPQIVFLKQFVKDASRDKSFSGLNATFDALILSLNERLKKYESNYDVIIATFLDPRYKNSLFKPQRNNLLHDEKIIEELVNRLKEIQTCEQHDDEMDSLTLSDIDDASESNNKDNHAGSNYDFNECISRYVSKSSKIKRQSSCSDKNLALSLSSEIDLYQSQVNAERNSDPVKWWKFKQEFFPLLKVLASKHLCSPPSSVESERLFSIGGNIYTPHRNCLKSDTGEELMFLCDNLRLKNED